MLTGFYIVCNDAQLTDRSGTELVRQTFSEGAHGELETSIYRTLDGSTQICLTVETCPEDVLISWVEVANISKSDLVITRLDSFRATLPVGDWTLHAHESSWGHEFTPITMPLKGTIVLETLSGRSTNGKMPVFSLTTPEGRVLHAAIAWSGNWIVRFEPAGIGSLDGAPGPRARYRVCGGLSDWEFCKTLAPGDSLRSPEAVFVERDRGTVEEAGRAIARMASRQWIPHTPLTDTVPVEWNSWWPYEDSRITQDAFKANVDVAARLGFDICTLDAGWFGDPQSPHGWWEIRGDWDVVNTNRFPSGIRALSDYCHDRGMKFGLWCEIEAVDKLAALNVKRPDVLAMRDGDPIGYVCMGNPATVDWAFDTLSSLIENYKADWIKLDFNADPGAGCNRADHGHEPGDGLYAHYQGYYGLLDRLREAYPEVVFENCASGGLRVDLGIMKHLPVTFLSDPDYPVHALQLVWGASGFLPARACLKFSWSQNHMGDKNSAEEPISADMPRHKFDYIMRIAMLNIFGVSCRLPDFPDWCQDRLAEHIAFYKSTLRPFIRSADVYRLTAQPLRTGGGDRWAAFLYALPDRRRAALYVFRLTGGEEERTIKLAGLDPDTAYTLTYQDAPANELSARANGRELMETGLIFSGLAEEASQIVILGAEA